MYWHNRPPHKGETCIAIRDGVEPYVTTDTDDLEAAVDDFCAGYETNETEWDDVLIVERYWEGNRTEWCHPPVQARHGRLSRFPDTRLRTIQAPHND